MNSLPAWTQDDATPIPVHDPGPVPSGRYPAVVIDSGTRVARYADAEGHPTGEQYSYSYFTLMLLGGQYAGVTIEDRILSHDDANWRERDTAYCRMSELCHATGAFDATTSRQLHGHPLQVDVVTFGRTAMITHYLSPEECPPSPPLRSWEQ